VREGTQVPGLTTGVVLSGGPWAFDMNDDGWVLFQAFFTGGDSAAGYHDQGIFAYRPQEGLRLLVASGDPLQVGGTNVGLITALSMANGSGGEDGRASALTDDGRFVFHATYTGGTGIFIGQVPEPGALGAVVLTGLLLSRRHRRMR
jgi:hypothetical protein